MRDHTRFIIRDGSCSFLEDNWTGLGCIADLFAEEDLSALHVSVHDLFSVSGWSPILPPVIRDFVAPFSPSFTGGPDFMVWEPMASGKFSLQSAYHIVRPSKPVAPSLRLLWAKRVPLKIAFLVWWVWNRLIPFNDVLTSFGFHLPSKCPCCCSADTLDHGFVHCVAARPLWGWLASIFNVHVVYNTGLRQQLLFFLGSNGCGFL